MDEREVECWIEEGRTFRWMAEEYERKYNLSVTPTMFSNFRARKGLPNRNTRDPSLIPWQVREEHWGRIELGVLRYEAQLREGRTPPEGWAQRHESFLRRMREQDLVILYDPDTEEGFYLVPRLPGDDDLIRRPGR